MEAYQQLEVEFRPWTGELSNVVACSSGTSALHLALEAMRLPLGSQVIVPNYTMVAVARAVTLAGHSPVFVDVDYDRLLIDPSQVRKALASCPDAKAIMAVHTFGRQCPMEELHQIAEERELAIIEDCAEAHGVLPHPKSAAACWSFYKNKIIAGEEGGAVAFRDPEHARLARELRCIGFKPEHDYNHHPRGHNYRLANSLAELILKSIHRAQEKSLVPSSGCALLAGRSWTEMRSYIVDYFNAICPTKWVTPPREAEWVYDVRIPGMTIETQRKVVICLLEKQIPVRYGFKPMSWQEEYKYHINFGTWVSDKAASEVIYIPIEPGKFEKKCADELFSCLKSAVKSSC